MENDGITAIGHVFINVVNLEKSIAFYRDILGLSHVVKTDSFNAFALAGHTHFCIIPGKPKPQKTEFDFLAGNVDKVHAYLKENGIKVTELKDDEKTGHRSFQATDPDGYTFTVYNNNHADM